MNRPPRPLLQASLAGLCLAMCSAFASAQDWPAGKPVRILNGFPPGGASDIQARAIAARLSQNLGAPFVVENKPGASTAIAARELIKSPADGSTLMYTITSTTSNVPHFFAKPPYDIFKDFTPLGLGSYTRTILVATAKAPYGTVKELIDYAKANPGKVNYGSFGLGSTAHINGEVLGANAGINIVHVPYKGDAPALSDLLAGQIQALFVSGSVAMPHLKSGKLRALGVSTVDRSSALPETPAIGEVVPGFSAGIWIGMFAPAGTPREIVQKVNQSLGRYLKNPELQERLRSDGTEPAYSTPEDFGKLIDREVKMWGEVVHLGNISIN